MKQIKDMTTAEWRKAWQSASSEILAEEYVKSWYDPVLKRFGGRVENMFVEAALDMVDGLSTFDTKTTVVLLFCMFAAMTPKEFLEICKAPR